ncbi:Fe-Mn family superoxide dismutase, partial [Bacillus thuringiensis]
IHKNLFFLFLHYTIMKALIIEEVYYLKYQNRRPEFVTNWWHTVNWDQVNEKYLQAIQSQKH